MDSFYIFMLALDTLPNLLILEHCQGCLSVANYILLASYILVLVHM